jgi:hypothetical protein
MSKKGNDHIEVAINFRMNYTFTSLNLIITVCGQTIESMLSYVEYLLMFSPLFVLFVFRSVTNQTFGP